MSYVKHTWIDNETVTSAKLNNIEDGIEEAAQSGGSALIITDTNGTLDKTFAEIYNSLLAGTPCYIHHTDNRAISTLDNTYTYFLSVATIVKVLKYSDRYRVYAASNSTYSPGNYDTIGIPGIWTYSATNSSSYPTYYRSTFVNSSSVLDDVNR